MMQGSHRDRLVRFYQRYNPSKVSDVDIILESFEGDEDRMFAALVERYGPEPTVSAIQTTPFDDVRSALEHKALNHASSPSGEKAPDAAETPLRASSEPSPKRTRSRGEAVVRSTADANQLSSSVRSVARSNLLHIHNRLRQVVVEMSQIDPAHLAEKLTGVKDPGGAERTDALDVLQALANMRRLASAFLEESLPIVLHAESCSAPNEKQRESVPPAASPQAGLATELTPPGVVEVVLPHDVLLPPQTREQVVQPAFSACSSASVEPVCLTLHPGRYYENLILTDGVQLELKPSYVGAQVEICPLDPGVPTITVGHKALLRATGVMFVGNALGGESLVSSLLHCTAGGEAVLQNCRALGVGVSAQGLGATLRGIDCSFHSCGFAAVHLSGGAFGSFDKSRFEDCEGSLRVRDSTFRMAECTVVGSFADSIVCHGAVEGAVEACDITDGTESGLLLSPTSMVVLKRTSITGHKHYAVYAPSGAKFAVSQCNLKNNAMGEYNRPPSLSHEWR